MKHRPTATRSKLLLMVTLIAIAAAAIVARTRTHAQPTRNILVDGTAASSAAVQPLPATGSNPPAVAAAGAGAPATTAGMRAYIDPETGALGTSSALPPLTEAEKALLESAQEPRQVVLPDGSVMVELNGTCQEFMLLQLDANGNRSVQCVQDPKKALQGPAPAAMPGER